MGIHYLGEYLILLETGQDSQNFYLQGMLTEGPIPSTISLLTNLTEKRISDLVGSSSMRFPNLQEMIRMERLTLRNCLLAGPIPDYIGQMLSIKNLFLKTTNYLEGFLNGLTTKERCK